MKKNRPVPTDQRNQNRQTIIDTFLWENLYGEKRAAGEFILELERDLISKALRICNGNKKKSAELLEMKYTTLVEKLKRYGIHVHKREIFDDVIFRITEERRNFRGSEGLLEG